MIQYFILLCLKEKNKIEQHEQLLKFWLPRLEEGEIYSRRDWLTCNQESRKDKREDTCNGIACVNYMLWCMPHEDDFQSLLLFWTTHSSSFEQSFTLLNLEFILLQEILFLVQNVFGCVFNSVRIHIFFIFEECISSLSPLFLPLVLLHFFNLLSLVLFSHY